MKPMKRENKKAVNSTGAARAHELDLVKAQTHEISTTCTTIAKDTHQPTQQEKGNPTAQDKSSALHVIQKCTADDVAKAAYTHHFAGNVWSLMAIR